MRSVLGRLEHLEELALPRLDPNEPGATFTILTGHDGEHEDCPDRVFTIRIDRATTPERGEDEG
jgi:hypothetical protein